jgi:DNA modification methylase
MVKLTLVQGDCLKYLPKIPDESIDLVVTDPPYNSNIEWDKKDDEWQFKWLKEIKRTLKEGGSLYVFFAPLNMYGIEGFIRREFTLKNIGVWYHSNLYGAGMSYGNDRWKSTWDVILYAVKGQKAKHNQNISQKGYLKYGKGFDIFEYAQPRPLLHKAQKPLNLIEKLVDCSSNEGDIILDPFLGSGTTMEACLHLNRNCIGIEIEPKYTEICKKRLNWGSTLGDVEFKYEVVS